MKQGLLLCALVLSSFISFSQGCPIDFKRNNGNGGGCPGGKITMTWPTCPAIIPTIDSLKADGVLIPVVIGAGVCVNGAVEYCVLGGNIPATGMITAYFSINGDPNTAYSCNAPEGGPLPIELGAFFAKRDKATVGLTWKTESEINASTFSIERKTSVGFETVGTVTALNSATGSTYSFTDPNNSKTVSEYRLKMIDKDGSYKYSEIRSVKGMGAVSDFTVFPNPSTGNAKVSITDITEATDVQVVDNSGRIVKTVSMNNQQSIQLNNLQKGMYMIRIVNKTSGESLTKKLTVLN
jgi:hypothetical protein